MKHKLAFIFFILLTTILTSCSPTELKIDKSKNIEIEKSKNAMEFIISPGDPITSTPFVDRGTMYTGLVNGQLFATNVETKKTLWEFNSPEYHIDGLKAFDSINNFTTDNEKLYFGTSFRLYALDKNTGKLVWKNEIREWVNAAPLVSNGRVIIGTDNGKIMSIDAYNGKVIWEISTQKKLGVRSVIKESNGNIFVYANDGLLYSIDEIEGKVNWIYRTHLADNDWSKNQIGSLLLTSPIISENHIYFGSWDGYFYAVNESTGRLVWEKNTNGYISTFPIKVEDTLYFSNDATSFALNAKSGNVIWSRKVGNSSINTAFVYHKEKLIYGVQNKIITLSAITGDLITEKEINYKGGKDYVKLISKFDQTIYFTTISRPGVLSFEKLE
ncbi:PQQ-binding-like beta-propeller repeat protein [Paenibacillus agricola]|uniref:PQQ-binding-like beta-propeller repeat protein n=1 Tax=Paenibacillus agricola TaxID=2716264 RepID=A0ABX0JH62_9BACL|nr:PQQ-binding-like beta-propeller repeat protein [Paenibacillus agricola]NHN34624.1 PQQ-binding-like beta-propeller repeat protein [Paenibacillus agricola]